jgi:hypothetical protein
MPAIVVFNLTVLGWVLFRYFTASRAMYLGDFLTTALIGCGIGLVTGGITLGVMMTMKR